MANDTRKPLGTNTSRGTEAAQAAELKRHRRTALATEVSADLAASSSYIAKYGSFADLAREHYQSTDPT